MNGRRKSKGGGKRPALRGESCVIQAKKNGRGVEKGKEGEEVKGQPARFLTQSLKKSLEPRKGVSVSIQKGNQPFVDIVVCHLLVQGQT